MIGGLCAGTLACAGTESASEDTGVPSAASTVDSFSHVADSAWVNVTGPSLVGFYPIRSNEQLERDEGLATALDDFAYHIGSAMDSLIAEGMTVQYRGGDTVWLRTTSLRWRFARAADSADIGYIFTDTAGRLAVIYGVRTSPDLIDYTREFKTTGAVRPR